MRSVRDLHHLHPFAVSLTFFTPSSGCCDLGEHPIPQYSMPRTHFGLQPLIKYNKRDDPQILTWCRSIEDMWGIRIKDLIVVRPEWGSQPSQYPVRHLGPFSSERPPAGRIDKETGIVGARATNDGDIDPALQQQTLGGLGGVGSGVGGRTGESLPSLKSSGLLDSWNSNNSFVAPHSRIDSTNTNVRESTRTPTLESDVRSTTMPVGLQWLANESR